MRRKRIWWTLHPDVERKQPNARFGSVWDAIPEAKDDSVGRNSVPTNEPGLRADGRRKGPQHSQQFAAETAAVSGLTKQSINQHLARADALGDGLDRIAGTTV